MFRIVLVLSISFPEPAKPKYRMFSYAGTLHKEHQCASLIVHQGTSHVARFESSEKVELTPPPTSVLHTGVTLKFTPYLTCSNSFCYMKLIIWRSGKRKEYPPGIPVAEFQIFPLPRSILIHAFCLVRDSGWQEDRVLSQLCHCQSVFSQQRQQEAFWYLWCRMSVMDS